MSDALIAHEVEQKVLGAIISDSMAMSQVVKFLDEKCFYTEAHQNIWKSMIAVFDDSVDIDLLTLTKKLKEKRLFDMVGGISYLMNLSNQVVTSNNIEPWSKELVEAKVRRILNHIAVEILARSKDPGEDPFELMDEVNGKLDEAVNITDGEARSTGERVGAIIKKIEYAKSVDGITGVSSFIKNLDEVTGGFQAPDLIIIAGRPGMGKTAAALSFGTEQAKAGMPVGFFSLEMTDLQLTMRRLTQETGVSYMNFVQGKNIDKATMAQLHEIKKNWDNDGFHISEEKTLRGILAKARYWKKKYGIKIIYVDYLQLIIHHLEGKGNREQEISFISRSLKGLAKELDIPVVAICQLNRSVESRGGEKKPMLSDLRESGAIEQDGDIVMFTYRPEYYGITEDSEGESTIGIGWFMIEKHRNGAQGDIKCSWDGIKMRWESYAYDTLQSNLDFQEELPKSKPYGFEGDAIFPDEEPDPNE